MKMNKLRLIDVVAKEMDLSKANATKAVELIFGVEAGTSGFWDR